MDIFVPKPNRPKQSHFQAIVGGNIDFSEAGIANFINLFTNLVRNVRVVNQETKKRGGDLVLIGLPKSDLLR